MSNPHLKAPEGATLPAHKLTGLWHRCRDFVTEQSAGEWSDKVIADDTDALFYFISKEIKIAQTELKR